MNTVTRLIALSLLAFLAFGQYSTFREHDSKYPELSSKALEFVDDDRTEAGKILLTYTTDKYPLRPSLYALRRNCAPILLAKGGHRLSVRALWRGIRDGHPVLIFATAPYLSILGVMLLAVACSALGLVVSRRRSGRFVYGLFLLVSLLAYLATLVLHFGFAIPPQFGRTAVHLFSIEPYVAYGLTGGVTLLLLLSRNAAPLGVSAPPEDETAATKSVAEPRGSPPDPRGAGSNPPPLPMQERPSHTPSASPHPALPRRTASTVSTARPVSQPSMPGIVATSVQSRLSSTDRSIVDDAEQALDDLARSRSRGGMRDKEYELMRRQILKQLAKREFSEPTAETARGERLESEAVPIRHGAARKTPDVPSADGTWECRCGQLNSGANTHCRCGRVPKATV